MEFAQTNWQTDGLLPWANFCGGGGTKERQFTICALMSLNLQGPGNQLILFRFNTFLLILLLFGFGNGRSDYRYMLLRAILQALSFIQVTATLDLLFEISECSYLLLWGSFSFNINSRYIFTVHVCNFTKLVHMIKVHEF